MGASVDMERFDAAVKSMTNIDVSKETAEGVLNNLLRLYDYNWEHIEADNYHTLVDAIFDESNLTKRKKKRAEKKNLDSDHCNKKLKLKERGQKAKSNLHSNVNEKPAEVPRQPGEEALNRKAITAQLPRPKTETHCSSLPPESQDKYETSLAVMRAQVPGPITHTGHEGAHVISSVQHVASQKFKGVSVSREGHMADARSRKAIVSSKDYYKNFEVPLSNSRKGKLSLSFNPSLVNRSNFHMPDMESICKAMETTCQCVIDLGSGSKPTVPQSLRPNQASSSCMPLNNLTRFGRSSVDGVRQNNSSNMQIIQHQLPTRAKRQCHDVNDIAKGEERVKIPIVTGDNEALPPPFHYIPQNITSQDAYVNLSLARIGDENCCSNCFGDCLATPLPCACASETGGEFAYTRNGLLKKEFLNSCVLMFEEPHKHPHFYCKICPLEKIKIDQKSDSPEAKVNPDPCKEHLIRKFIKECWRKCGCTRNCGNRVVQRGITRNLQVFLTPEGKGWGLRTSEKLPPGAFICEYVGEILTNSELYERNMQRTSKVKHTYPLNLNADWGTEGVLKDDEALCLDCTFYGNVARFINHRCFDGNLIGIPVEIETPDHHYYHLAFFTKRKVEPYQELTWDYEIDFDDVDHPIKAFKCRCGSEYCRDKKRIPKIEK